MTELPTPADPRATTGWLVGWTLTATPDELMRETASPLLVTLGLQPGTLEFANPEVRDTLPLANEHPASCRCHAAGLRLQVESENNGVVVSCVMLDANAMMIEAEPVLFEPLIKHAGFTTEGGTSVRFTAGDRHHVIAVYDRHDHPNRMVVLSGVGTSSALLAKARGYLLRDAHAELDAAVITTKSGRTIAGITPVEYLLSRLRPPTASIPCPWLADEQEEPAWEAELLYLAVCALLPYAPQIAAGLIVNQLELLNEERQLPIRGGIRLPMEYGIHLTPTLAAMCNVYVERTGQWPMDVDRAVAALSRYLDGLLEAWESRTDLAESAPVFGVTVQREMAHFKSLMNRLDTPHRDITRRARERHIRVRQLILRNQETSVWRLALDPARWATLPKASRSETARAISDHFGHATGDLFPANGSVLAWIAEAFGSLAVNDLAYWREQYRNFLNRLQETAEQQVRLTGGVTHEVESITQWAMLAWVDEGRLQDMSGAPGYRAGLFIRRHQRTLAACLAGIFVAIFLVVAWLQLRPAMPRAVFDAYMGMAIQHYSSGHYQESLAVLAEMEARGATYHPLVMFMQGKNHYRMNAFDEAMELFQKNTRIDPENPAFPYNTALAHVQKKEYDQAIAIFQRVAADFERKDPVIAAKARRASEIVQELQRNQRQTIAPEQKR